MTRSPVVARRRLGATLKELRVGRRLKIEDAARELQCSNSKVSRLENGKAVPRERDVRDLIVLYGNAAQQKSDELYALVEESSSGDESIVTKYSDVLDGDLVSDDARRFMALEQDCTSFSSFQPDLVPGLLQTEAYADAVARLFHPSHSPEQRERFVALRRERQEITRPVDQQQAVAFAFVVGEQAIRRQIGGTDVMRDQLEQLQADLSDGLSHISFQIAPIELAVPGALGGPFAILRFADPRDQDVVYLEGRNSATYLESDEHVRQYEVTFDALVAESLNQKQTIALLEDTVRQMR